MKDPELASRLDRLTAVFVDVIAISLLCSPILYFAGLVDVTELPKNDVYLQETDPVKNLITSLIFSVVFFVVNFQFLRNDGQTMGKRWHSIKIVHMDGEKASMTTILKRYAVFMFVPLIPLAGDAISLVNSLLIFAAAKRCGHDLIAGTKVVYVSKSNEEVL